MTATPSTLPGLNAELQRQSRIPGLRTMLVGGSGVGKTYSLCTLADMGLNLRVLFTEPGMETLAQYYQDRNQELPPNIHWKYIAPAAPSWDAMLDSAKKINTMSFEGLAKLSDINKKEYDEFYRILSTLANFVSDRDGTQLGQVDDWGTDTVLAIDSLTGLSMAAMNMVTGSKPVKSMADWGVAISNLEMFLTKISTALRCHVVLISHLERETDELTGGTQLMASTLGKKLAPKIPRFFSDVIHVKREGPKFVWSTASTNVDLKARNVKIADGLAPTFSQLIESWKKNGGVIEA